MPTEDQEIRVRSTTLIYECPCVPPFPLPPIALQDSRVSL